MKSERNHLSGNIFYKVTKLPSNAFAHHNAVFLSDKALTTEQHQKSYLIKLPNKKTNSVVYYPVIFDKSIPMKTLAMSSILRDDLYYNLDEEIEFTLQERKKEEEQTVSIMYAEVQAMLPSSQKQHKKINETKLIASFNHALENYPLSSEQVLFVPYNDDEYHGILQIKVLSNIIIDQLIYQADEKTIVIFTSASPQLFSIPINETPLPKKLSLDFTSKGVGGHKEQLKQIIQESFLPRALPPEYLEAYGEKHKNAGILLYGPPGTGKTLIARSIAECFTKDKVKVVNGPELKNKYVGQSQENLRNIFKEAEEEWEQKGIDSDLYVFIFDEIDALVPIRGARSGSTGVEDDMVAQFLTILDGVNSPKNIIVIGTTNRKDLIDPALLRHGRLGVVVEIGLPDEESRREIFSIHTKKMRANHLIDVNLDYWAKMTVNYTGGEIEQLVSKARHYAEADCFEGTSDIVFKESIKSIDQLAKVTEQHFRQAYAEIVPAFGIDAKFSHFNENNFAVYNNEVGRIIEDFQTSINTLKDNHTNQVSYLISGEHGVGKTYLAMHLANLSGATYIKMISPDMLVSLPLDKQLRLIKEEFENAHKASFSVIILDQLEDLLNADADLQLCNNQLRIMFAIMLKKTEESNNKSLIIATASNKTFILRMRLYFDEMQELHTITFDHEHLQTTKIILENLCKKLNYSITGNIKFLPNNSKVTLTIQELIYKINKYVSQETHEKVFNLNDFYCFIMGNNDKDVLNSHQLSSSQDSLFHIKSNRVNQQKKVIPDNTGLKSFNQGTY